MDSHPVAPVGSASRLDRAAALEAAIHSRGVSVVVIVKHDAPLIVYTKEAELA